MQRERAREILAESICVNVEDCKDDMNLQHDLGADSLSLLSFGVDIVDEFGVSESKLKYDVETVGDLLDYVDAAINS